MIFVVIVHGMVPIVHVFLYFDGNKVSVDGVSYLDLLQEVIWPRLHEIADRSALWWMQDGVPPHCTNAALAFLNKFEG